MISSQGNYITSSPVHSEFAPDGIPSALALALVLPSLGEAIAAIEVGGIPAFSIVRQIFNIQGIWCMAPVERSLQLWGKKAGAFPDSHLANLGAANQLGVSISDEA